jgi:hypothetical protein
MGRKAAIKDEMSVEELRAYMGLPEPVAARRFCLGCLKYFPSEHVGHRHCKSCENKVRAEVDLEDLVCKKLEAKLPKRKKKTKKSENV